MGSVSLHVPGRARPEARDLHVQDGSDWFVAWYKNQIKGNIDYSLLLSFWQFVIVCIISLGSAIIIRYRSTCIPDVYCWLFWYHNFPERYHRKLFDRQIPVCGDSTQKKESCLRRTYPGVLFWSYTHIYVYYFWYINDIPNHFMLFQGNKPVPYSPRICTGDKVITQVNYVRFPEIIVDNKISLDPPPPPPPDPPTHPYIYI